MEDADRQRPVRRGDEDLVPRVEHRARGAEERVRRPDAEVHVLAPIDVRDAEALARARGDRVSQLGEPRRRAVPVER